MPLIIEPVLAPIMDLFNHHADPHVQVDVRCLLLQYVLNIFFNFEASDRPSQCRRRNGHGQVICAGNFVLELVVNARVMLAANSRTRAAV